jgi:hypothetical protein
MASNVQAELTTLLNEGSSEPGEHGNRFRLRSSCAGPTPPQEIDRLRANGRVTEDLLGMWEVCREARLYEDVDYGQWGLRLLSATEASARTEVERESRPHDFDQNVLVIGEFLGDSELLVRTTSPVPEGRIEVALPLDDRPDWYVVSSSLADFFRAYRQAHGLKFWEESAA